MREIQFRLPAGPHEAYTDLAAQGMVGQKFFHLEDHGFSGTVTAAVLDGRDLLLTIQED
jgi:hypothetical protein